MTESEAIKELQDNMDLPFGVTVSDEASRIAINALEEIQEYREVEQKLKELHGDWIDLLSFGEVYVEWVAKHNNGVPQKIIHLTDEHVDMWNEYKAIGTIEEFKALKEKSAKKKPKEIDCIGFNTLVCPVCKYALYLYEPYCDNCGQKLDWSDEE